VTLVPRLGHVREVRKMQTSIIIFAICESVKLTAGVFGKSSVLILLENLCRRDEAETYANRFLGEHGHGAVAALMGAVVMPAGTHPR